jgi:hypothetical protein
MLTRRAPHRTPADARAACAAPLKSLAAARHRPAAAAHAFRQASGLSSLPTAPLLFTDACIMPSGISEQGMLSDTNERRDLSMSKGRRLPSAGLGSRWSSSTPTDSTALGVARGGDGRHLVVRDDARPECRHRQSPRSRGQAVYANYVVELGAQRPRQPYRTSNREGGRRCLADTNGFTRWPQRR